MTLAVFRQLKSEDCFDDNLNLKGKVWGQVNYHHNCAYPDSHLHLIWERDGELRKARINKEPPTVNNGYKIAYIWPEEKRRAWIGLWAQMSELPQLFIAA